MQMRILAASIAAVLGMGGIASAADVYSGGGSLKDAPVYAPVSTWSGFHIGVGGGYGSVNHDLNLFYTPQYYEDPKLLELNGLGGEGAFGTVEVGFDRQFGRFVVGVFFNYDFTDIDTKLSVPVLGYSTKVSLEDMWAVGGRAGYVISPDTLAYVLGGYTEGHFKLPSGFSGGKDPTGYVVGGGLETKLGGPWSLKVEYRFTSFDRETLFNDGYFRLTSDTDVQTARAVLSYRGDFFGADIVPLK